MYNKSNLTFNYQNTGNLGILCCRGTYIFIIRITVSKKADATIYTQYYLLSMPVIKNSCYQWLYPAIHCKEYDKITMINETRQNIVIPTTDIFAVKFHTIVLISCTGQLNSKEELRFFNWMHASFRQRSACICVRITWSSISLRCQFV